MGREVDREIRSWSRKPARDQLALLKDGLDLDGARIIAYWEGDPWSSSLVISASAPRKHRPGTRWAFCFLPFHSPDPGELIFSDDSEEEAQPEKIADAWEIRRLLEVPGIGERPEICDLLISLGRRRDDLDLPTLGSFSTHRDPLVRYVALGVLSWQPGISNAQIGEKFSEESDPLVRELAIRFSEGRTRRKTRA